MVNQALLRVDMTMLSIRDHISRINVGPANGPDIPPPLAQATFIDTLLCTKLSRSKNSQVSRPRFLFTFTPRLLPCLPNFQKVQARDLWRLLSSLVWACRPEQIIKIPSRCR
jgi:hypothetical protein